MKKFIFNYFETVIEVLEKQYILKFEESRDLFVGYGKSDITGPISQVNMMGFVTPTQTATGMHGTILHLFFVILFENYFIFELKNQLESIHLINIIKLF